MIVDRAVKFLPAHLLTGAFRNPRLASNQFIVISQPGCAVGVVEVLDFGGIAS